MNTNKIFLVLPIFITTIVLISLNACNSSEAKVNKPEAIEVTNYDIYTLDGCEYVRFGHGNFSWGSHKGNCSNPIHKEQPQLEIEHKDYIASDEKHFDCYVNSIEQDVKDKNIYWVETECGIVFQSDKSYKVGEVLKNFKSGKHK
jgi:hypothetical protein